MKLTSRILAQSTAITPTTLIHIVTTADTSQSSAGSSYKAQLSQLASIFSNCDITQLTYTEAENLVQNNLLKKGCFYHITDASPFFTQEGVIVQAVETNVFSLQGTGVFWNADYNAQGSYTNEPTYSGNIGIWSSNIPGVSVTIGKVVVYNNRNYINLTGSLGTAPVNDNVNWRLLDYGSDNGYIKEYDFVKYVFNSNVIIYRADGRLNEVEYSIVEFDENPLYTFQWGNNEAYDNKIRGVKSKFLATNSRLPFYSNTINNGEYVAKTGFAESVGFFRYNTIENQGFVELEMECLGEFQDNYVNGEKCSLRVTKMVAGAEILQNKFINSVVELTDIQSGIRIIQNFVADSLIEISTGTTNGYFAGNSITSGAEIKIIQLSYEFKNNNCATFPVKYVTMPYDIVNKTHISNCSNMPIVLDMDDGAYYDVLNSRLILTGEYGSFGEYTLTNCTGKIISGISLSNTTYTIPRKFIPYSGESVTFQHSLVAGAVNYNLLCDAPASSNLLTGRNTGSDFIEYIVQDDSIQVHKRTNLVLLA